MSSNIRARRIVLAIVLMVIVFALTACNASDYTPVATHPRVAQCDMSETQQILNDFNARSEHNSNLFLDSEMAKFGCIAPQLASK